MQEWIADCIAGLKANCWIAVIPPTGWFAHAEPIVKRAEEDTGELFWKLLEASLAHAAASRSTPFTLVQLSEPKLDEKLRIYLRSHLPPALNFHLTSELAANATAWRYAAQPRLDLLPGINQKLDTIADRISHSAPSVAMTKPNNAPSPSGHFFGRDDVLSRIELVLKEKRRICLWAAGGVGRRRQPLPTLRAESQIMQRFSGLMPLPALRSATRMKAFSL